jgi:hypothetical protein
MTEKQIIESTNKDMIIAANQFVGLFHTALLLAAAEHNDSMLERLAGAAEHYRDHLAKYIDLCGDTAIDSDVIDLHQYFADNVTDIRRALEHRGPENDDSEKWKEG